MISSPQRLSEEARQTQTKPHPDAPNNQARVREGILYYLRVCVCKMPADLNEKKVAACMVNSLMNVDYCIYYP